MSDSPITMLFCNEGRFLGMVCNLYGGKGDIHVFGEQGMIFVVFSVKQEFKMQV